MSDRVVLTGAGWTANWGGYLVDELTDHVLSKPAIRTDSYFVDRFLTTFNFEEVWHSTRFWYDEYLRQPEDTRVMTDGVKKSQEKSAILEKAIIEVFQEMDADIRDYPTPINTDRVNEFFRRLCESNLNSPTYIFTLNQDLWLERYLWNVGEISLLGIKPREKFGTSSVQNVVTIPSDPKTPKELGAEAPGAHVVKLHGSYNWVDESGRLVIMGRAKLGKIYKKPILSAYYSLLRDQLCKAKKILIVGYGYGDAHINTAIAHAAQARGAKVWNVGVCLRSEFYSTMHELRTKVSSEDRNEYNIYRGDQIYRAIRGYLATPFDRLFGPLASGPFDNRLEQFLSTD